MKRGISLLISLAILAVIYWKIDFQGLLQVLHRCDRGWMAISLGMVVPITLTTAWRLQQLLPNQPETWAFQDEPCRPPIPRPRTALPFAEANRLILVASVLNMVLPSKMGDIAKAYFMQQRGYLSGARSLALVVFEKACDLMSLLLWCAFGLLLYPQKDRLFWLMTLSVVVGLVILGLLLGSRSFSDLFFALGRRLAPPRFAPKLGRVRESWQEIQRYGWRDRRQLLKITLTSLFIWFLHLLQIWFFIVALNAWTPFLANLALSPLAILAGLLPLTFAGVGTRDAALIWFYQPYFAAPTAAALGVLCTSRYLLPALGGLPFLGQYLDILRKAEWQPKSR